jgi:hypothetical protein
MFNVSILVLVSNTGVTDRAPSLMLIATRYIHQRYVSKVVDAYQPSNIRFVKVEFENAELHLVARNNGGQHVVVKLPTFAVHDFYTVGSLYPTIASPQQCSLGGGGEDPLLRIEVDTKPLREEGGGEEEMGPEVTLKIMPVYLVYNGRLIQSLVEFFVPPAVLNLDALGEIAAAEMNKLAVKARGALEDDVLRGGGQSGRRPPLIHVDAAAPTVILAEDVLEEDTLVLLVNLGHIGVNTTLKRPNGGRQEGESGSAESSADGSAGGGAGGGEGGILSTTRRFDWGVSESQAAMGYDGYDLGVTGKNHDVTKYTYWGVY